MRSKKGWRESGREGEGRGEEVKEEGRKERKKRKGGRKGGGSERRKGEGDPSPQFPCILVGKHHCTALCYMKLAKLKNMSYILGKRSTDPTEE